MECVSTSFMRLEMHNYSSAKGCESYKTRETISCTRYWIKIKVELKIFLLDTCAEVKLVNRFTELYPTHNTIPFRIYSTIIYGERSWLKLEKRLFYPMNLYPGEKKNKTSQTLLFNILEKFNFNSMSIEKFFRELKKKSVYSK